MPAAEKSASQAACAATSASEWPSRPAGSSGHARPARCIGTPATSRWTSVPMPMRGTGAEVRHVGIMPEGPSQWCRDHSPSALGAGRSPRRARRAGDQLCHRDGAHHPGVARRRGRRADHPAHPRCRRRAGHRGPRPPRQAGARRSASCCSCWRCFALGRVAGPAVVVATAARLVGARGARARSRSCCSATPALVDALPVLVGLITWVAVHSALIDALRREQRRPDLESRERRVFVMVAGVVAAASLGIAVAGRFVGAGRRHVEVSRRLLRIPGVTRRQPPAAHVAGRRRDRARGRRPTRTST